ncbi:hypothetical protein BofuT4_P021810.1 [Botrytis cinerea T4]|uniref:Uncharacterized protein n=1 Tax=Botryotinia fuckeliana (strain T4) TaxID=999810 RepID=G2YHC8_BOTF4|nr:hypothetical protein BofuT4_P021810.1 [Botrytis cinerea T4]
MVPVLLVVEVLTKRGPYLKKFYGIEEHDCPKGYGKFCDWPSEKGRSVFFRVYVQLTTLRDRYDFVAEIKLACQMAKERHLEADLWPLLSTAELYARNSDWYCRERIVSTELYF